MQTFCIAPVDAAGAAGISDWRGLFARLFSTPAVQQLLSMESLAWDGVTVAELAEILKRPPTSASRAAVAAEISLIQAWGGFDAQWYGTRYGA